MIQSRSLFRFSVYDESKRLPSFNAARLASRSWSETWPQSPKACLPRKSNGFSASDRSKSIAAGVATTCPSLNSGKSGVGGLRGFRGLSSALAMDSSPVLVVETKSALAVGKPRSDDQIAHTPFPACLWQPLKTSLERKRPTCVVSTGRLMRPVEPKSEIKGVPSQGATRGGGLRKQLETASERCCMRFQHITM